MALLGVDLVGVSAGTQGWTFPVLGQKSQNNSNLLRLRMVTLFPCRALKVFWRRSRDTIQQAGYGS
jgi:hypothetical protein